MTEKKTAEEFEAEQRAIPDDRLAEMAQNALSRLCETGGRSITMTVPPRIDDTDMVIAEVIKRFKAYAAQQKPEMPSAKDAEAEAENEQEIESLMQKVAYKEATDSDKERLAELWNKRQKSEIKMPTKEAIVQYFNNHFNCHADVIIGDYETTETAMTVDAVLKMIEWLRNQTTER